MGTIQVGQEVLIKRGQRSGWHGIVVEKICEGWWAVNFGGEGEGCRAFTFSSLELEPHKGTVVFESGQRAALLAKE